MNLPNKLTILRVILVPFMVFFLLTDFAGPAGKWIALFLFAAASFTDLLDGNIARKFNLITNFGKFMDPLADKLLVCCAMLCLVELRKIPAWVVIVIISREFILNGIRLVASDKGIVIAASGWGKYKTVFQMLMIISMIADLGGVFDTISLILMWAALTLTIISLVDYVARNKKVIVMEKAHDIGPEQKLVELLNEKGLSVTAAESCTGGMIASAIVNVPGASDVFKEGYVTYSNEAKERLLGVRHETLKSFGAVSRQTAAEMAKGAAKASGADIAISSTGIAGPGGGTDEKPVGLVYIGIYVGGAAETFRHIFSGGRSEIRRQAVEKALEAATDKIKTI